MKNLFIGIVLFLSCGFILGFACDWYVSIDHHSDKNVKESKSIIVGYTPAEIDTLKDLVLKGDKDAYPGLIEAYIDISYYQQESLLYSLIMGNRFNLSHAYYFVYSDWTGIYNIHFRDEKIDDNTKKIVVDYLKRGAELKDFVSINELKDICQK
ncbi:MAG: hypothetical protein GX416_11740 [Bacteroidales bacterium]|nr:hypothetical protein [Bacteroidales bacterium]